MNHDEAKQVGQKLAGRGRSRVRNAVGVLRCAVDVPVAARRRPLAAAGKINRRVVGHGLVTVEGLENASINFLGRPVVGSAWKFEATFKSAHIDNHGFAAAGLKTQWSFLLPGGESFSIDGEIMVTREDSTPNDAEVLAQAIASRMMGRPDLTAPSDSV